jgi:arginine N-succinyltransferase
MQVQAPARREIEEFAARSESMWGNMSSEQIIVVRPAALGDVDGLVGLAIAAGPGMTNLQPDPDTLTAKVEASVAALAQARDSLASPVLFVLDMGGQMVGTAAVYPNIGSHWPFYSYKRSAITNVSQVLNKRVTTEVLNPVNDLVGYAEVGGLFVSPVARGKAVGRLAARSRYMFMAEHRAFFPAKVMAEMRGFQTNTGVSPVWDAIGSRFYDLPFEEADKLSGLLGNQFIAELGPKLPIYADLLPAGAQAALGRPHRDSQRAYELLLEEGFEDMGYIDIFDGGPQVVANLDQIACSRQNRVSIVEIGEPTEGAQTLVSAGHGDAFRATRGAAVVAGETVRIAADMAQALGVKAGDPLRHTPF